MNKDVNAEEPSLWLETSHKTVQDRRRVKFVAGAFSQLEIALLRRATMTNPAVIPQIGGIAAAANGRIAQINGLAGTPETQAVAAMAGPLLGRLFVPMPDDEQVYLQAAEKVAEQARKFGETHDGTKLQSLDSLIRTTPAHFSEQFKKKYLTE